MSPSTNLRLVLQVLQQQLQQQLEQQRQLQQQHLNLMAIQAHDSAMDLVSQPQIPVHVPAQAPVQVPVHVPAQVSAQIQVHAPILAPPQDEGSVFLEDIMVDVTHNLV
ncbi:hypothetical protein BC939DRAFT_495841 [Gamsiella multidivaricata]|uniref:uncharacterized protein n=1 Tax=Gamsiella multidivaricata TaxID=101098 RepID=UPI00221EE233|nr:uncharacterized protein BC939DRAFT_495841 [Gamsiella multidivaricata]KAI7818593.1 hypothetical protein BC939DRAFT_495841 [Gamsiella multidivaricata]